MRITDKQIVAFVDDELPEKDANEIAALAKSDPKLARRIARYRQTGSLLKTAFAPIGDQPVPEDLMRLVRNGEAGERNGFLSFAPRLGALKEQVREFFSPNALKGAMAAAVLLISGFSAAQFLIRDGADYLGTGQGMILAQGELSRTLDQDLSGHAEEGRAFRVKFSFTAKGGGICRVVETINRQSMTGVACRKDGAWQMVALAASFQSSSGVKDGFRPAGGETLPRALQATVQDLRAGDPLGKEEEARARDQGWK